MIIIENRQQREIVIENRQQREICRAQTTRLLREKIVSLPHYTLPLYILRENLVSPHTKLSLHTKGKKSVPRTIFSLCAKVYWYTSSILSTRAKIYHQCKKFTTTVSSSYVNGRVRIKFEDGQVRLILR